MSKLLNFLEYNINLTSEFVNTPKPDWVNQHDFQSGFFEGTYVLCKNKLELLKEIKELLNEQEKTGD